MRLVDREDMERAEKHLRAMADDLAARLDEAKYARISLDPWGAMAHLPLPAEAVRQAVLKKLGC